MVNDIAVITSMINIVHRLVKINRKTRKHQSRDFQSNAVISVIFAKCRDSPCFPNDF